MAGVSFFFADVKFAGDIISLDFYRNCAETIAHYDRRRSEIQSLIPCMAADVTVLLSGMPMAGTTAILADKYGYNSSFASQCILYLPVYPLLHFRYCRCFCDIFESRFKFTGGQYIMRAKKMEEGRQHSS